MTTPLPSARVQPREVAAVAGVGAYVGLLAWSMEHTSWNVIGALVILPVLLLASWPILTHVLANEPDRWIRQLIWCALVLKLAASVGRWWANFILYEGESDASQYHTLGSQLAELYRNGGWSIETGKPFIGTGFVVIFTAFIYTVTGPTLMGAFLVFSWIGFWGSVLLYVAFRLAVPEGNRRRYAALLFLMPSMLFWPSSVGKEALVTFLLGVSAYGSARLLTRRQHGFIPLVAGLGGLSLIRPHIALMFFAGVFVASLFRPAAIPNPITPVLKVAGVVVLALGGALLLIQTSEFLGIDERGILNFDQTVTEHTVEKTDEGGSAFTPTPVRSIVDLPVATITVLFRPFPFEAHNVQALFVSIEGLVLIAIIVLSFRRLANVLPYARRRLYVLAALPYIFLFIFGFSAFGNFGLLARERVMVYPFLFILLCVPPAPVRKLRRAIRRVAEKPSLIDRPERVLA